MATEQRTQWQRYRRYYERFGLVAAQPKTRAYSSAVFSFLAASLFGLYAILPTMRTIIFLNREIVDKTKVNREMEDKITSLIESQAAIEAAGDTLTLVSEAIPETAKPVELTLTLRNLTRVAGASTSAIQVSSVPLLVEATVSAQTAAQAAGFPVTVTTNGSFASLKSFIDRLLSLKRIVTIDSIRFTQATGVAGTPAGSSLQLVLQLKAFYQGQ